MDMKTVVIDSLEHISTSGNAGSTPELVAVSGDKPDQICEPMGALEQLLSSLSLDHETVDTLMNIGSDILTDGEVSGFRRGFRYQLPTRERGVQGGGCAHLPHDAFVPWISARLFENRPGHLALKEITHMVGKNKSAAHAADTSMSGREKQDMQRLVSASNYTRNGGYLQV